VTRIAILGGGPAGYEAALVAVQLGADVTVVDRDGAGGACVLFDCVPSKALIATSDAVTAFRGAPELGMRAHPGEVVVDVTTMNARIKALAAKQSADIRARLERDGVRWVEGRGRFAETQPAGARGLDVLDRDGAVIERLEADVVLIGAGATPRELAGSPPDGERILSWRQLYDLTELPEHLVVVGSGVTGAEFASGFSELGVPVTLVSSRDRVLPGEDVDAADVIERVFTAGGGTLVKQARAAKARRTASGVEVDLLSGDVVRGSHALICVGSVPATDDLGLRHVGADVASAATSSSDRVSRTTSPGIYAAGTAPASSCWLRWPPCRAASRCGMRWGRR
jgi:dihydrolipoamide dehydrogenase